MPHLLLELFSEEIPARMQKDAANALQKNVTDALVARGLVYEGAKAFVTPRRLALAVHGVPLASQDIIEEKKGPRVDAPQQALDGFLKGAGLSSLSEATIQSDPKKGDFYIAKSVKKGESAETIIAEIMPSIIKNFAWAKSMRWGSSNALKWVRPLHSIICTFDKEHEEPSVIHFDVEGIKSSNNTKGHRFLAPNAFTVGRLDDYIEKLAKHKVILDSQARKDKIIHEAKTLCFAQGLELVEDEGLAHEVAGLVEYPVILMGSFEERFLTIPDEVIRATIRANQKCFVVRNPKTGRLTNRFIITSNIEATDSGLAIIAGNERVIRARLSDAKFFYETDKAKPLASRLDKFKTITYHKDIGSQFERIERLVKNAVKIAPLVGADLALTEQAARLAKADLVTEMVGEFPELQGLMGRYYGELEGLPQQVSNAFEAHYKPVGLSDSLPTEPVSIAVALADKTDQLVSFWLIDEKPTGSKDPYALRRAALGIIRIILENNLSFSLKSLFDPKIADDLFAFFIDRLKGFLRDKGQPHELIDAVFALPNQDNLLLVVKRIEALNLFLKSDDGVNLLAGTKRAANILRAEEKKDGAINAAINASLITLPQEKELYDAILITQQTAKPALEKHDYATAMQALSKLRAPVDNFFNDVIVNDEKADIRKNRLGLLASLRDLTLNIADFSKIGG